MFTYAAIFPNGKMYIGATTTSVDKRSKEHLSSSKKVDNKFYRAINKYGFENVEFREIKEHETKEEMFRCEKILIERHKTQKNGYNTTSGGEGNPGREYTDEERKKISLGQKERFSREEERLKTSEGMKEWNINNPDKFLEIKRKVADTLRTEEMRKQASEKQKDYIKNNPEAAKLHGEKLSKLFEKDHSYRSSISSSLGGTPVRVYKDGKEVAVYLTKNSMVTDMQLNPGNVGHYFKGKRSHVNGYTFVKDRSVLEEGYF